MLKLPKLTPRLKLVAQMVRPGGIVADIGTDHAYLPVFLVNSGRNPRAFACDVKEGPLARAKRTLEAYGAQEKVELLLSDGLAEVERADDIVLAGMGGELIAELLHRSTLAHRPDVSLVLQPMTAPAELRAFLCREGFRMQHEEAVHEGGKLYTVIQAAFTGEAFEPDVLFCHTGRLPQAGGADEKDFLRRESARLMKKAHGLSRSSSRAEEADAVERLAAQIAEIAERMSSERA